MKITGGETLDPDRSTINAQKEMYCHRSHKNVIEVLGEESIQTSGVCFALTKIEKFYT